MSYIKDKVLFLTEKTSFKFDDFEHFKIKFKFKNKKYIGIIFNYDNEYKVYSKDRIFRLEEIDIIKIISVFKLFDGAQIKFKNNGKIIKGYIHYFDPSFFESNNNLIIIDYNNYEKSYNINFCDIISNDYTII